MSRHRRHINMASREDMFLGWLTASISTLCCEMQNYCRRDKIDAMSLHAVQLELNEALRAGDSPHRLSLSLLSSLNLGVTIPPIDLSFIDRRCSHDPLTPTHARG